VKSEKLEVKRFTIAIPDLERVTRVPKLLVVDEVMGFEW